MYKLTLVEKVMIKKILQQLKAKSSSVGEVELQEFFDEIMKKEAELAEKKAKFKEDYQRGARVTKHRFTI